MRLTLLLTALISFTAFADGISRADFMNQTGFKEGSYHLHSGFDRAAVDDDGDTCPKGGPFEVLQMGDGSVTLNFGDAKPLMFAIGQNRSFKQGGCLISVKTTVARDTAEVTRETDCRLDHDRMQRKDSYKITGNAKGFHFEHIMLLNGNKKPVHYWTCDYER